MCKFYFSHCYLLVWLPNYGSCLLFFFWISISLSSPYSEPQFCSTAEQRGSTFPALSDLCNLSPKARWGTHTAEIIVIDCFITLYAKTQLCQEMHTSFWDVWVFKTSIWPIPAALWHFYPTKHHIFVLGTEAILFFHQTCMLLWIF